MHRGCQHRDAHRIGPFRFRPIGKPIWPFPSVAPHARRFPRKPALIARHTVPASGPVRRRFRPESLSLPPGGSDAVLPPPFRAFRSTWPKPGFPFARSDCRKATFRQRATHCICGSPDSVRGHPEACFPILLRASLPDRSVMLSLSFQGFPSETSSSLGNTTCLDIVYCFNLK